MIRIKTFTFNALQENTYLVYDDEGSSMIVDPGCYEVHEQNELVDYIKKNNLKKIAQR